MHLDGTRAWHVGCMALAQRHLFTGPLPADELKRYYARYPLSEQSA